MRKKKRTTAKKKIYKYDNSRRSEKSAQMQRVVLRAMVSLLVKKSGGEVRIDEIAKKSGISERSIFRFFKDKKALMAATDEYVMMHVQDMLLKVEATTVPQFAKMVFKRFDQNQRFMTFYLRSSFGYAARLRFRKKLNELLIASLLREKKLVMTEQNRTQVALIVSLINAKLWDDLRHDFGLSGEQIGDVIAWAVTRLSEGLA